MSTKKAAHWAKLRYLALETDAQRLVAISPNCDPKKPPEWYEPETFRHAQKLFKTYGSILFLSKFYGMLVMFFLYKGLDPILSTGNSSTVKSIFVRYLSMYLHFRNWSRYDPFEPSSESYKSIKQVRGYHRQVCTKLNKAAQLEPNGVAILWASQYTMSATLFGFVGLMTLFPKELGFHNFTPQDLHSIYHYWRVIGHSLGIDDRFNICAGSNEQILALCKMIYHKDIIQKLAAQDEPLSIKLNETICLSMSYLSPMMKYKIVFRYLAPCMKLKRSQFALVTLSDKVHYRMFKFVMQQCTKSVLLNWCMTTVQNVLVDVVVKLSALFKWFLDRRHSELYLHVDQRCPFTIKINYIHKL